MLENVARPTSESGDLEGMLKGRGNLSFLHLCVLCLWIQTVED